jgi:acyl carrier protein
MVEKLLAIINEILGENGKEPLQQVNGQLSLRSDLDFDSLSLAELTVRIEDEFDVDIFEDGLVDKLEEVIEKIEKG